MLRVHQPNIPGTIAFKALPDIYVVSANERNEPAKKFPKKINSFLGNLGNKSVPGSSYASDFFLCEMAAGERV
jgi:hypothetical protein